MEKHETLRVLCISFHAPPTIRPQAILLGKMIPEWVRQGIQPIVVTHAGQGTWDAGVPVYTINDLSSMRILDRLPFVRRFRDWLYFRTSAAFILGIIRKHNCGLIYSFSNPQSSNVLAALVHKKNTAIPFVAHFSDPWYDNPIRTDRPAARRKLRTMEQLIMEQCAAVVFTCDQGKQLVMRKYPDVIRAKASVIPHCYDPRDYPTPRPHAGRFVISHVGAFYPQRDPEPLFKAFAAMLSDNPGLEHRCTLRLVGAVSYTQFTQKRLDSLITRYRLARVIELIPATSYAESLRYMVESDCLIAIDANLPASPFLPSKVIDYVGSRVPIVGITPSDSATAGVLRELNYRYFTRDETNALAHYLASIISGSEKPRTNDAARKKYDVQSTTQELISIFRTVSTIAQTTV